MTKLFNSRDELESIFYDRAIRRLRIGDKVFCIVKYQNEFHLTDGLCPHQNQPLHEGTLNGFGEIICPLHFYRFNLKTGQESNRLCRDLNVYRLFFNEKGVFTELGL